MTRHLLFFVFLVLVACVEDEPTQTVGYKKPLDERKVMMEHTSNINRAFTEEDLRDIEKYLSNPSRNWPMDSSGSGIFYYIFEKHDSLRPMLDNVVELDYQVMLLDGTICYDSKEEGTTLFTVGKDDIESGLHEAVKMMGVGDKGVFILPYSRAHGLLGDDEKIPPLSVVVYRLELIGIE